MIEGCNAEMRSHAQSPLGTWHIGMQSVDHFPIIYEDISCMLPCLRFQTCVGSRSTQSWVPPLCFCFCCRCYCHLSLLYPCLLMFMRLYLWAILVKSSVACGVYWFWTATLGWNDTFLPNQLESSIIIWVNFKALIKQVSPHKTSSQIAKI